MDKSFTPSRVYAEVTGVRCVLVMVLSFREVNIIIYVRNVYVCVCVFGCTTQKGSIIVALDTILFLYFVASECGMSPSVENLKSR